MAVEAIKAWLNDKDYEKGVAIYNSLSCCNKRLVKNFRSRKNARNKLTLEYELKKYYEKHQHKPTPPKPVIVQTSITNDTQHQEKSKLEARAKEEANRVLYSSLPHDLKPKHRRAVQLFYDMCDLKQVLNGLADEEEEKARLIQIQIRQKDTEKKLLWQELQYYNKHKQYLVTEDPNDFSKLTPEEKTKQLYNLRSYVTKKTKRVEGWYQELETAQGNEALKLETKITKAESSIHQMQINIVELKKQLGIE